MTHAPNISAYLKKLRVEHVSFLLVMDELKVSKRPKQNGINEANAPPIHPPLSPCLYNPNLLMDPNGVSRFRPSRPRSAE